VNYRNTFVLVLGYVLHTIGFTVIEECSKQCNEAENVLDFEFFNFHNSMSGMHNFRRCNVHTEGGRKLRLFKEESFR